MQRDNPLLSCLLCLSFPWMDVVGELGHLPHRSELTSGPCACDFAWILIVYTYHSDRMRQHQQGESNEHLFKRKEARRCFRGKGTCSQP